MSQLNFVKQIASTAVYNRGMRYYEKGAIVNYSVTEKKHGVFLIKGSVRGNYYYDLNIELQISKRGQLFYNTRCTCPYDWGGECKHVVAILIKFFKEDYNDLKKRILEERNYLQLLEMSQEKKEEKIFYYIRGFEDEKLVNFKIYLKAFPPGQEEKDYRELSQIIKELMYGDKSSFYKLSALDRYRFDYLEQQSYSKGREGNTFLLAKTEENFLFLKEIANEGSLFFEENSQKLQIDSGISPEYIIMGDENQVKIEIVSDFNYFQSRNNDLAWTIIDNTVYPVINKELLNLNKEIKIPEEKKGEFLFELLPSLQKKYQFELCDELQCYKLIEIEPRVKLYLDFKEDILYCSAEITLDGQLYEGAEILTIDTEKKDYLRSDKDEKIWYSKNYETIKDLVTLLEEFEFHVSTDAFFIKDKNDIQEFITSGLIHLKEEWEVEQSDSFQEIEVKSVELKASIEIVDNEDNGKIDWFEFKVFYHLEGKTFSREELMEMIKYNKNGEAYIQFGGNYYFLQEGKNEKNLKDIISLADKQDDGHYRSHNYNLLYYGNLLQDSGINFKGNKVYNDIEEDISKQKLVEEEQESIPAGLKTILRDYQKQGFYWLRFLYKYHFAGILADDMGLGKTIQTLCLLKSLDIKKPALVVCPRTLIYNWSEEIEKFFPEMKSLVYYGNPEERIAMLGELEDYEILITSYSILSRDYQDLNKSLDFSYCILDEAQHIKNYKTKRAQSVKLINAEYKLALTGTPIENSVEELWSIFDFLMPGYLGSYSFFRKNYLNPIVNDNDKEKLKELKNRVRPFILRRKKEDVLKELPDKMINIQQVEMSSLQQDTYRFVLEEVRGEILDTVQEKGFNRSRIHILAALTRLRQICNHPSLVLDKADSQASSGKIDTLMEMVEEAIEGGHKIVVFSQFVKMLKLIRDRFDFEPSIKEVADVLVPQYLIGFIYGALVQSIAAEHFERMVAMKKALDNAKDMLKTLKYTAQRIRQEKITTELQEISSQGLYTD
ncbi:MAG: F0F1 ATP synthase subunit gamma [Bacillota bacterium]